MKTTNLKLNRFWIIFSLPLVLSLLTPNLGFSQEAPLIVIDWERGGSGIGTPFMYDYPPGSTPYADAVVSGSNALQGGRSFSIDWQLRGSQYFGWGVDLRMGDTIQGFDASAYRAIAFKVQLVNGDDRFEIKIKDTHKVEPIIDFNSCLDLGTQVQDCEINLNSPLLQKLDLHSLENINFSFDAKKISPRRGTIIIDDFKFIK